MNSSIQRQHQQYDEEGQLKWNQSTWKSLKCLFSASTIIRMNCVDVVALAVI